MMLPRSTCQHVNVQLATHTVRVLRWHRAACKICIPRVALCISVCHRTSFPTRVNMSLCSLHPLSLRVTWQRMSTYHCAPCLCNFMLDGSMGAASVRTHARGGRGGRGGGLARTHAHRAWAACSDSKRKSECRRLHVHMSGNQIVSHACLACFKVDVLRLGGRLNVSHIMPTSPPIQCTICHVKCNAPGHLSDMLTATSLPGLAS